MKITRILRYVAAGVALLLIVLVAAATVALYVIDFNRYKPLIAAEVRKAIGRDLTISGDLRIKISFAPEIVAEGVTLSNAEWGSRPDMASVRRLEGQFALSSLLSGVIEVQRIELIGADVLLEVGPQGRANFDLAPPEAPKPAEQRPPKDSATPFSTVSQLREVKISESRLIYDNAATGTNFDTIVESLTLQSRGPDTPLDLKYEGGINGAPVRVGATLGSLTGLLEPDGPWPLDVSVEAGGAALTAIGTIEAPLLGRGFDLAVSAKGERTSGLSRVAGFEVPELGAYLLLARFTGDTSSALNLSELKARVGASDLAGDVTVQLAGERPVIGGKFVSRRIDLAGTGARGTLLGTATSLSLAGETLLIERFETALSGAAVSISGAVADVFALAGLDLAVAARGDRFADLSELAGTELPSAGAYSLTGRVTGDFAGTIDVSGLAAQLGDSDVSGSATMWLSGRAWAVAANLESRSIDLPGLGIAGAPLRDAQAMFSLEDNTLDVRSLKAELSGAAVEVAGTIADPAETAELDLAIAATGAELAGLSQLAGGRMPDLGPYSLSGRLTGNPRQTLRAIDVAGHAGKSDVKGNIVVTLDGTRPFIDATLSSTNIDLVGLGLVAGQPDAAATQATAPKPDRLFSDDPLPQQELQKVDADLRYDAAMVTGRRGSFRNAAVVFSLKDGLLDIPQFRAELYDGTLEGAIKIDGRTEVVVLDVTAALRKIDLDPVLAQTSAGGALEGRVNLDLAAKGRGRSIRDIMAGLDGKVDFVMGRGRVRSRTLQRWVGGTTQILSNVLALDTGGYSTINCALAAFDVKKGLATSNGLLLDTDVAAFVGKGTVNLSTEAIDMIIDPKVKRLTLSAAVPVHIRGTLMNPEYKLDEKAVARRVGGLLGGLVYPPALIIGLGELGTVKKGDCLGATAAAQDQGAPGQAEEATEQKPTRLPGKILEGTGETITKGLKKLFGE